VQRLVKDSVPPGLASAGIHASRLARILLNEPPMDRLSATSATRGRARAAAVVVVSLVAFVILALRPSPSQGGAAAPAPANLSRMVVIGDSILAGFASGGLVRRGRMGQRDSAPALIARQAHVSLPQPLMTRPGVPPPFVIVDRNHNGVLDPGEVKRRSNGIGFRAQPKKEVRNLAVPGERVSTVTDAVDIRDVIGDAIDGNVRGRDVMKVLILDLPIQDEPVSQIRRARDLSPSFLMVWLGANDVLGMAERTNPNLGATPEEFGTQYSGLLDALADTGAPMVVANIPDVTRIPVLRHAAGEVTTCRADDGTSRPVAATDLLSIQLDRSLLPEPPCNRVLDSAEQAFVRETVIAFNARIADAVVGTEQRRGVPIATVDAFALFDQFADQGVDVRGDGSQVLTTGYLGGLFTLDGVHPTRTTHALIANAFIDAINARFGNGFARVDVAAIASRDFFVGNRFRPAGEPPFGIIGKDEGAVDEALDHIADEIDDVIDDVKDFFKDIF
jgi:phospholipase/lecithinase/hemolysin